MSQVRLEILGLRWRSFRWEGWVPSHALHFIAVIFECPLILKKFVFVSSDSVCYNSSKQDY